MSFRGGTLLTAENATPSGRLEVVPADGPSPQVNVGDVFTGATAGPVDYSQFGGYLIAATTLGTVQRGNLPPTVATAPAKRQLSVATYNVENLAPGDPGPRAASTRRARCGRPAASRWWASSPSTASRHS